MIFSYEYRDKNEVDDLLTRPLKLSGDPATLPAVSLATFHSLSSPPSNIP